MPYVVFIIPRLIEKAGKDTAVVWNGRERDVLDEYRYAVSVTRGPAILRKPRNCSVCWAIWSPSLEASIFFS